MSAVLQGPRSLSTPMKTECSLLVFGEALGDMESLLTMPTFCKVELRFRRILDPLRGSTLSGPDTLLLRKNWLKCTQKKREKTKCVLYFCFSVNISMIDVYISTALQNDTVLWDLKHTLKHTHASLHLYKPHTQHIHKHWSIFECVVCVCACALVTCAYVCVRVCVCTRTRANISQPPSVWVSEWVSVWTHCVCVLHTHIYKHTHGWSLSVCNRALIEP